MSEAAVDRVFTWDESQQEAITRCCNMQERIVPVTGVAGTGKTTIIREVYTTLSDAGYTVVLCAPTGKAAKRIQEATGIPAMTIHRLLEYPHPGERDDHGQALVSTDPRRGKAIKMYDPIERKYYVRDNPINYQVVLCDEYAMVNREMHRNLIDALPLGGRLCMFGDVNQLKPIEQGKLAAAESPFEAGLRRFNGTVLTTIHRTQEGSGVALNGDRILRGMIPQRKPDFVLQITTQPVNRLCDTVMDMLERGINMGTNAGQVISCTKKSWIGTYKLNVALQGLLNPLPHGSRVRLPRHKWEDKLPISIGVGDKVIWTENAYDLRSVWERFEELRDPDMEREDMPDADPPRRYVPTPPDKIIMNGESGVVTALTDEGGVQIDLGDRVVNVPHKQDVDLRRGGQATIDPRRSIDLGFCITTHKAQGSEWPHIIYVLNESTLFMQSRHNFYTAISRARETTTVITDQKVTEQQCHTDHVCAREEQHTMNDDRQMTKEQLLERARLLVGGTKQAAYGDAYDNHDRIAVMWRTYFHARMSNSDAMDEIDAEDVAMCMLLVKVSRAAQRRGAVDVCGTDTFLDMISYAAIAGECRERAVAADLAAMIEDE